jgi:hypothetical protein
MMTSDEGARVFRSKPVYVFIPVGLICGVLAYGSLIFIGVALWMRKLRIAAMLSAGCFVLVLPFWASLFFINNLLQTTIMSSIGSLRDNPFADLASIFMQGIRIEPAAAIYVLGGAVMLIAVINRGQWPLNRSSEER